MNSLVVVLNSFRIDVTQLNLIFKWQHRKIVKHTQAIRRQPPTNCLSVFEHFVELALKGLRLKRKANVVYLGLYQTFIK